MNQEYVYFSLLEDRRAIHEECLHCPFILQYDLVRIIQKTFPQKGKER